MAWREMKSCLANGNLTHPGRRSNVDFSGRQREILRGSLPQSAILFLASCILLFLGMSRQPHIYDGLLNK